MIETIHPNHNDIIVWKFKTEPLDLAQTTKIFKIIQQKFPDNKVIAIPDNSCFEVFERDDLINHLKNIINELEEVK